MLNQLGALGSLGQAHGLGILGSAQTQQSMALSQAAADARMAALSRQQSLYSRLSALSACNYKVSEFSSVKSKVYRLMNKIMQKTELSYIRFDNALQLLDSENLDLIKKICRRWEDYSKDRENKGKMYSAVIVLRDLERVVYGFTV